MALPSMFSERQGSSGSTRRTGAILRLLIGVAIDAAGLALLLTMFAVSLTGAPLQPVTTILATFGVGLAVLAAGGMVALFSHGPRRANGQQSKFGRSP